MILLLVFDIDGTLCDTYGIDSQCYRQALSDTFGFEDVSENWGEYPHTTDSGILEALFATRLGRSPTSHEVEAMKTRFCDLLATTIRQDSNHCRPIAGGIGFLNQLKMKRIPVAIATGGWADSAKLKLRVAGYQVSGLPFASADDAISREEICSLAVQMALDAYQQVFERVVYFGDGLWDEQACQKLGFEFIGVTQTPDKFQSTHFVIEHFDDQSLWNKLKIH